MKIKDKISELARNMSADNASLKEALREHSIVNVTDDEVPEGMSRLIYNHSINKTKLGLEVLGLSKPTYKKRIDEAIDAGVIPEPIANNKSVLFPLSSVHALKAYLEHETYSDKYKAITVATKNYKGGTGKSMTTISMAMATALDLELNARVLVIDLDPQGSSAKGIINVREEDELYITASDLLCVDYEPDGEVAQLLEAGNDFEDIVLAAPFKTHIPNLDVMTAFPSDEKFTDYYWELPEDKRSAHLQLLANKVMPVLKERYDIIYFDLPPQNSPITWSAAEATTMMLTPITPRTYDYASTMTFFQTFEGIVEALPSKGENIKWIKVLPVNYNVASRQEKKTFDRLIRAIGGDMYTTPIKHSPLFLEASSMNRTIFDVRKTESTCTALQYDAAITSVNEVYNSFINDLKVIASK